MRKLFFYIAIQLLFIVNVRAQQSGDLDTTFGRPELTMGDSSRFNNGLRKIIIQPDGKVLVAGSFTTYNSVSFPYLVRLKQDDLPDTTFHPGLFDGAINNMILQPDGKIVVCGSYDTHNSDTSSGILRLNTDGSTDMTFAFNTSPNMTGVSLALQSDGKILLGGNFSFYRGDSAKCLVRLNTDGTVDTAFASNIGAGFNNWVQTVIVQTDGKIIVGGSFTMFNGMDADHIIRLNSDGTPDTLFLIHPSFDDNVLTLALQPDGKIIAGGGFNSVDSIIQRCITRLNTDGTVDTTFHAGKGFNDLVFETCIQPDGKLLVGGRFSLFDSTDRRDCLIRLNADGTDDYTFYSGAECQNTLRTITLHSNGFILLGGDFIATNNTTRQHIARLDPNGVLDGSFNCNRGFSSLVTETCIQPDGKIIVSGPFNKYNGYGVSNIIRLMPDGSIDTTMHTKLNSNAADIVYDQTINKIYAVGTFTTCNLTSHKFIARINADGTTDTTFVNGYGFDQSAKALAIQSDGKVIAGGVFTFYDSTVANHIVRLQSNGSIDTTFISGTGFNGEVKDIVIQSDGKIVVCGEFSSYNSNSANNLIRINADGSIDTSFHFTTGLDDVGVSLALQADGKILVGGLFTHYNSTYCQRIARLNTDGTFDLTFQSGIGFSNGVVNEIIVQPDGQILAAGDFLKYNTFDSPSLVRINTDGSYDNGLVVGTGFNNKLRTISLQQDGKIICGGEFTMYQPYHINYLCRLEYVLQVSVSEVPVSEFLVYPNPSNGNLSIELNGKISYPAFLRITNVAGQEVQRSILFNNRSTVTIDQPDGIYFLMISDNRINYSKKIIIK